MSDIGKLAFKHFEKALVGLLFVGFVYSLIAYGPWKGREDFEGDLEKLGEQVAAMDLRTGVPAPEDLVEKFNLAGRLEPQAALEQPLFWNLAELRTQEAVVLPPADVIAKRERGFIPVEWQVNTNQQDTQSTLQLVGVQVDRAVVKDGLPAEFVNLTKTEGRDYMLPGELHKLAKKVASVTMPNQAPQKTTTLLRSQPARATQQAPYSTDDLFNALHDGLINETQLNRLVQDGMRKGYYGAEDRMGVQENFLGMRMLKQDFKRSGSGSRRPGGPVAPKLSDQELTKLILEQLGYKGGGNYGKAVTELETAETAQDIQVVQKEKTAGPPPELLVTFDEIKTFVDTAVNPDAEYVYRVKFWALDTSTENPKLCDSAYSNNTAIVSPKPNTEFYLTGVVREVEKASIVVRKWMYASNKWEVRNYLVAPGEEIGRTEIMPKLDTAGQPVLESGVMVTEPVDFSTGCILLGYRMRPQSFENRVTSTEQDPVTGQMLSVDNVVHVLYDTPQIVYSDRKGLLRVKWQSPSMELAS